MGDLTSQQEAQRSSFLLRLAYGDFGLTRTFWLYNVGVNFLYVLIVLVLYVTGLEILEVPVTLIYFTYTPFVIAGVWTSARIYQGLKLWAWLAQVIALLSVLRFARNVYEFFGGMPGSF